MDPTIDCLFSFVNVFPNTKLVRPQEEQFLSEFCGNFACTLASVSLSLKVVAFG